MSRLARAFLALTLSAAILSTPALASDASDAWKQANEMKTAIRKAADENARAEAHKSFEDFCKKKVELLSNTKGSMSKLDLMYLGLVQVWAGDKEGGISTLRSAVEKKEDSKYAANIHANLVATLIEAGQPDGAAIEVERMQVLYAEAKETKTVVMNLGMAYRGAMQFEKAAKWLQVAFTNGNPSATKPLVNSLLMAGKQAEAVAAAKNAVETGVPQLKDDMTVLMNITEKIGTDVSDMLKFDAFVPSGNRPAMDDKVVVMGFWNVSSKSFKWTLKLLEGLKKQYGDDVVCIAATTYYKKNAESGQIEEAMTPETEREFGVKLADQENWIGWMGYLPDEAATKAWGLSALPHFVVVGRDKKLLFAHTMDYSGGGETDIRILRKVMDGATGR